MRNIDSISLFWNNNLYHSHTSSLGVCIFVEKLASYDVQSSCYVKNKSQILSQLVQSTSKQESCWKVPVFSKKLNTQTSGKWSPHCQITIGQVHVTNMHVIPKMSDLKSFSSDIMTKTACVQFLVRGNNTEKKKNHGMFSDLS